MRVKVERTRTYDLRTYVVRTRTRMRNGRAVCARACAISIILRVWFPGVRYLEAIMHCKAPLGAQTLSAVRNREASASRRLLKYYNYGNFNP